MAVGRLNDTASSVGFKSSGQQRTARVCRKHSVASGPGSRSQQNSVGNSPLYVAILTQINQVHVFQLTFFNNSFIITLTYYYVYQVAILSLPIKNP